MCATLTDPTRAFLYARSASETQNAPTKQVDQQLQRLREYARHRSFVIVGEACDAAQGGNKLSRPGLNIVMSELTCRPPTFDLLLATNPTRLARNFVLLGAITTCLTDAGIKIEFIDDSHVELSLADHRQERLQKGYVDHLSLRPGGDCEEG